MNHIAIDLGGKESQVCVRDSEGRILEQGRWQTGLVGRYLEEHSPSRVIVETSSEAFAIADQALKAGHEVRVVPATLVKSLGVGGHGVKTDKRDAQALSEVSTRVNLPSVHIPSPLSREWKGLCSSRECLVESRTKLINHARGYLRTKVKRVRTGGVMTFSKRVREKLLATPEGMPMFVERELLCVEKLSEQIREAGKEVSEIARRDERSNRLMTVPGVGPVTAMRFVAALDEVSRFKGAHAVESYLGLTPGENSSSMRKCITSVTKAGSPRVRWALCQAAQTAFRTRRTDPMVKWAVEIAKRRGRNVAISALMRKMAGILYAMWRDGTRYDPVQGAAALSSSMQEGKTL